MTPVRSARARRSHRKPRKETLEGLGATIRAFRKAAKWSQDELADKAGVGRAYVGDIECARHNPRLSTLEAFADAFGITIGELFSGEPDRRSPKKPAR